MAAASNAEAPFVRDDESGPKLRGVDSVVDLLHAKIAVALEMPQPRDPRYRALARFFALVGIADAQRARVVDLEGRLLRLCDELDEAREELLAWTALAEDAAVTAARKIDGVR